MMHDPCERRRSLQSDELPPRLPRVDIDAPRAQIPLQLLQMRRRRDDDGSGAGVEPMLDELGDGLDECRVLLVELHEVLVVAGIPPARGWRKPVSEVEDVHSRRLSDNICRAAAGMRIFAAAGRRAPPTSL